MNARRYSMFMARLLPVLLLAGCLTTNIPAAPASVDPIFEARNTPPATPEFSQTRTVSLSAVGDILIHSRVYNSVESSEGYDFDPMLKKVKPYLEQADITVANSESIVGGSEIGLSSYPSFNSPFEVGDALKDAGVDLVTMANNHTLDRGIPAIESAIAYWDGIGMERTGAYLSPEERNQPTLMTVNDITFSFLAYTYGTNGIPVPAGKEYMVNLIDKELIKSDLQQAKELSEVVVLNLHFGEEYHPLPNAYQKDLAKFAAENGADIILGHHPHVLQPPEWIETADGRQVFVIYSLGNFLSGQRGMPKQIGTILTLDIEKQIKPQSSEISIKNPTFTNTFVKTRDDSWYELDLLENVDPEMNEQVKSHLSTWIKDVKFIE